MLLPGAAPAPTAQHRAKGKQNPPLASPAMKQELHRKAKWGSAKGVFTGRVRKAAGHREGHSEELTWDSGHGIIFKVT